MARSTSKRVMSVSVAMCKTAFTSANPCQVRVQVCMREVRTCEISTRAKLVDGQREFVRGFVHGPKRSAVSRVQENALRVGAEVENMCGGTWQAKRVHDASV